MARRKNSMPDNNYAAVKKPQLATKRPSLSPISAQPQLLPVNPLLQTLRFATIPRKNLDGNPHKDCFTSDWDYALKIIILQKRFAFTTMQGGCLESYIFIVSFPLQPVCPHQW